MLKLHSCYVRDMDHTWRMKPNKLQYNVLILITSGKLVYWINDRRVPLQPEEVLFIPAGSVRGGQAIEQHQRYATHFSVVNPVPTLPLLENKQYVKTRLTNFAYFKQRFSLLNHHWMVKGPYLKTTCYAVLLEMLSLMNYEVDQWSISEKKRKMVEDIKNYILHHYQHSITLEDLAQEIERTPNHTSYTFKKVTGFSPIEYLHQVRISKAKDLMLSGHMPIREVAERTGFCDQAYFNRIFHKVTGCSPTAFLNGKTDSTIWER
jgi:AraC-like DNA-binding protein